MDFFKLIHSIDELLYEVASWLLFYPITIWRILSSPIRTMRSVKRELSEEEPSQFDDVVPPPLFLLLTILLVHAIELATSGDSELVTSTRGLTRLINNDTSLIIFRILMFSILPLAAASQLVRAKRESTTTEALRAPFYAQCYAAGFFVLLSDGLSLVIERHLSFDDPHYYAILGASLLWLLAVEARWFAVELGSSVWKGLGEAAKMIGLWVLLFIPVVYLMS